MAFFNELGKKITDAGQSAMKKTRDFADTTKINTALSEQERALTAAYSKVGELYVNLHGEDYEEDFSELINCINDIKLKIKNYKLQIENIKGIVHCPNCNAPVSIESAFCNTCGAKMPIRENAELKCTHCGQPLKSDTKFCTNCGTPVSKVANDNSEVEIKEEPAEDNVTVCPNCQAKLEPDALFCTECGFSVSNDVSDTDEKQPEEAIESDIKKCPICGAELEDDDLFCTNCGAKL